MELILAIKELKNQKDENGISRIGKKELLVVDKISGEILTGKTSVLWGGRDLILENMDAPLLTPEHVEGDPEDASYMVIVIRCDNAVSVK
tara:strand:+ start:371 stop:640 length:270 start_codon:yes stop_codon:yes gene_type:complete